MQAVRKELGEIIFDLNNNELSTRFNKHSNSIGQLILHIGEVEWWWLNCIISGNKLTESDKQNVFWDILKKRNFASKNFSVQDCLKIVDQIRELTKEVLANFTDEDLVKVFYYETSWSNGKHEANLRWILHHLIDHEAHHKGQISMIKRLIRT